MPDSANPLLLKWVGEWLEEARMRNSKSFQSYKKAYDSLRANPISFSHPSEAKQLTGFGDKLCARLTAKMEAHCRENNLSPPVLRVGKSRRKRNSNICSDAPEDEINDSPPKKVRKSKLYVPQYRSGAYGLLLALATLCEAPPTYITKHESILLAQQHCDSSYTLPSEPGKTYTAWSSMKTLLDKQLVHERRCGTRKYALTSSGWACARSIKNYMDSSNSTQLISDSGLSYTNQNGGLETSMVSQSSPDLLPRANQAPDIVPIGIEVNSVSDLPNFTPIILEPGSFSVEMVLDTREVRCTKDRDYIENELIKKGIEPFKRSMTLGDITWVAKVHDPNRLSRLGVEGDEIILDYIVERKRLDDLISSIKDKRLNEQKFRLGRSGIKNVIYLIENITLIPGAHENIDEAILSIIAGMQIVNGYFVKVTQKIEDTIEYLANLSKILREKYASSYLHIIPTNVLTTTTYLPLLAKRREEEPGIDYHISYQAFGCLMSKSERLVLRDILIKMLMCIKGITGEKAMEIQKFWKTPFELAQAYRLIDAEKELSIEEIKKKKMKLVSCKTNHLTGRRKIGPTLSAAIYEVWGEEKLQIA
ncbi:Crossover junction endonuclease MUS81 [Erysiphe neolycopersici]|uniref:Crossover junction endonuclease MUS81 n=1 Tax=Erysiphe neolycopersici TaxID=212602 RepID=A0A420HEZ6_9PEZI|nr:Crossover junction endonuclease MUS81 [Erysiphe neolycopersici]